MSGSPATTTETTAPPPPPPATTCVYFTCRRCRATLFSAAEVVAHNPGDGAKKSFKYRRAGLESGGEATDGTADVAACTSYFLDPDESPWVAADIREANASGAPVEPDTIYCPNVRCRAKLGTQSWTGSQCSCGAWVTPAFRIHARAVDKMSASVPPS